MKDKYQNLTIAIVIAAALVSAASGCGGPGTYLDIDHPYPLFPCQRVHRENASLHSGAALFVVTHGQGWEPKLLDWPRGKIRARKCFKPHTSDELCMEIVAKVSRDGTVKIHNPPESRMDGDLVEHSRQWIEDIEKGFEKTVCLDPDSLRRKVEEYGYDSPI